MSKRPFHAHDWNGNGKYDLYEKVADRYIHDKMNKDEPKGQLYRYPTSFHDWDGDGQYGMLDNMTDNYLYDKANQMEEKATDVYIYKNVSEYKSESPEAKSSTDHKINAVLAWVIAILLNPVILLGIVGGLVIGFFGWFR